MRVTLREGEVLTFGNCGDRRLGFERLQREKRSEPVMKRNITGDVEKSSLQSVDGFFRRSHCTTYRREWLKPNLAPEGRLKNDQGRSFSRLVTPSFFVTPPVDRDESHTTNWNA